MSNKINKITQYIREKNPELQEDFSKIVWMILRNHNKDLCYDIDDEIMSGDTLAPIQLQHLLKAIDQAKGGDFFNMRTLCGKLELYGDGDINLDLSLSVQENLEQNPELVEFIYNLIKEDHE